MKEREFRRILNDKITFMNNEYVYVYQGIIEWKEDAAMSPDKYLEFTQSRAFKLVRGSFIKDEFYSIEKLGDPENVRWRHFKDLDEHSNNVYDSDIIEFCSPRTQEYHGDNKYVKLHAFKGEININSSRCFTNTEKDQNDKKAYEKTVTVTRNIHVDEWIDGPKDGEMFTVTVILSCSYCPPIVKIQKGFNMYKDGDEVPRYMVEPGYSPESGDWVYNSYDSKITELRSTHTVVEEEQEMTYNIAKPNVKFNKVWSASDFAYKYEDVTIDENRKVTHYKNSISKVNVDVTGDFIDDIYKFGIKLGSLETLYDVESLSLDITEKHPFARYVCCDQESFNWVDFRYTNYETHLSTVLRVTVERYPEEKEVYKVHIFYRDGFNNECEFAIDTEDDSLHISHSVSELFDAKHVYIRDFDGIPVYVGEFDQ